MKTKQTEPRMIKLTPERVQQLEAMAKKTKASTTVWTNHGEPQPLDDKHFGVDLETEAETDATRQAEPRVTQSDIDASILEKRREEIALPWEIRGNTSIVDSNNKTVANCAKDRAYIVKACNEYGKVSAQRDELLAALKGVFKVVESRVSNTELNNWQELLAAGRDAIANASK